jgi:RHS repeat-associated protein
MFWYGAGGELLEETNVNGIYPTDFIYYGGERVAKVDPYGQKHFFFANRLGSVATMTDAQGFYEQIWQYYPYGGDRVAYDTLNDPNTRWWLMNRMKFTGLWRDDETGLDHTLYRKYTSNLGRWLSPDPDNAGADESDPQSWNGYSYVGNNPIDRTDPTGQDWEVCVNNEQGGQNCFNLSNEQFEELYKNPGSGISSYRDYNTGTGTFSITGGEQVATFEYFAGPLSESGRIEGTDFANTIMVAPFAGLLTGGLSGAMGGTAVKSTPAEAAMKQELEAAGNVVKRVPRRGYPTPDFLVNGVRTELKTLTKAGPNTLKNAIEKAARQGKQILVDARNVNITADQARNQIMRAQGNVGGLAGRVTVLTKDGAVKF